MTYKRQEQNFEREGYIWLAEGEKRLSHSHEGGSHEHETKGKSSRLRLLLLAIIMLGIAGLAWGPTLFGRGPPGGAEHTATDISLIFIPAWLIMTVGVVAVSFYFSKKLLESEADRDNETVSPPTPAHH